MTIRQITAALAVLLSAACSGGESQAPVTMSVISDMPTTAITVLPRPDPIGLISATAQGLVAFDGEGRIEPALAERWIVTDDGRSFIFRIRRTKWADGRPVTSAAVAQSLQKQIGGSGQNRLKPLLSGIDRIIPMTGQVLEIRLKSPQQEFLQLLAQPEMAIFLGQSQNGTGPYQIHSVRSDVTRLRPAVIDVVDDVPARSQRDDIRVRREPAARAIARFAAREIALVTGGGFAALPLVRPAGIASSQFSTDPASGIFGLAVVRQSEALANINVRRALAMAIDRERLLGRFGLSSWGAQYALLPNQYDSATPPAALEWVGLSRDIRIARAKAYIAGAGKVSAIRVALPTGPGARLLFGAIAADWQRIGVSAVRVAMNDPADLRLIDEVAPQRSALWYIARLSCARGVACNVNAETALAAALAAQSPADRANALAEADAAIASDQVLIPIASPLRWSLVSPDLIGWRANAFAAHPLRHFVAAQGR